MTDTPDHIHRKQLEILLSKSIEERFLMGLEMMEEVRQIVRNSIRLQNPGISEKSITMEFIRRYYKNDLSTEYLEDVMRWMEQKH